MNATRKKIKRLTGHCPFSSPPPSALSHESSFHLAFCKGSEPPQQQQQAGGARSGPSHFRLLPACGKDGERRLPGGKTRMDRYFLLGSNCVRLNLQLCYRYYYFDLSSHRLSV